MFVISSQIIVIICQVNLGQVNFWIGGRVLCELQMYLTLCGGLIQIYR